MSKRTLETRTTGLFKKGNALFRLQNPKVAIFVIPDGGPAQGYVSHADQDWPEMHQAIQTLNVPFLPVLGPDNFETVADRQRGSSRSWSAGGMATPPSTSESSDSDRFMAEMLASVLDGSSDVPDQNITAHDHMAMPGYDLDSGALTDPTQRRVGPRPVPSLQHTPEPNVLQSMQIRASAESATATHRTSEPHVGCSLTGTSEPGPGRRAPEANMAEEVPTNRQTWLCGPPDGSSRRRKACDENEHSSRKKRLDSKRRRMVTRSQGGDAYIRQH